MANEPRYRPQREIGRVKMNLRKLEKEKERILPGLGLATYQAFLSGGIKEAELVTQCEQLKVLDAQIEQARHDIAALQAQVQEMKATQAAPYAPPFAGAVCPQCGAGYAPGMRFCGNCGGPLGPPTVAPPGPATDKCQACGAPMTPGARFCGECGAVSTAPVGAVPVPPPPPAASVPASPGAPVPAPAPSTPPSPPSPPVVAPPTPPAPAAVERSSEPDEKAARARCPSCGAEIDEQGAAFCGECGAKL